ncbi:MAG: ATP-binding protein, partial [Rikenellaceae bacterium]
SAMLLDATGYLWVGTYDGLSRYNGLGVNSVEFEDEESTLLNRRIRSLAEDSAHNIWIGSDIGVAKYDRQIDKTQRLPLPRFEEVEHINFEIIELLFLQEKQLVYAIAERFGLLIYNLSGDLIRTVELPLEATISDAILDEQQRVIFATNVGLFIYDPVVSDKIETVGGLASQPITTLTTCGDTLLVAPQSGLFKAEINFDHLSRSYSLEKLSQTLFAKHRCKTISIDSKGSLWLGTRMNGVQYIPEFTKKSLKEYSLLEDERISSFLLYGDEMWVGSFDNGIYRYTIADELFIDIGEHFNENILQLSKITELDSSNSLISTISKKAFVYNSQKNTLRESQQIKELNISANRSYVTTPNGTTWIFTDSRVWCSINSLGEVSKIKNNIIDSIATRIPMSVAADAQGYIWHGYNDNLYRIKIGEQGEPSKVESIKEHRLFANQEVPKIRTIYPDPLIKSVVWVGTTTMGLLRIEATEDLNESKVAAYTHASYDELSLPSNFVSSILRHSNGELWIGTEQGGVCRMTQTKDNKIAFEKQTTKDGLSNNVVKSLVEDSVGDLWIATNYGLNRLNVTSGEIYTFHQSDGLPFEQFWYSSTMLNSGELLFSGVNGVLLFNPNKLSVNRVPPKLEFAELRLLNRIIKPRQTVAGRVILNSILANESRIELKHNENIIQIGIDVLHQSTINNSQIRYRISPLSDEWLAQPSSTGYISLNGLEAGNYTLDVVAIDALGQQTSAKRVYIDIAPHPLRSQLAIIIYCILIIAIISIIVFIALRISSLRHSLILERVKKLNAEKLNREKQRYFMNISHELKTPLSLIVAPANALAQRFKFDVDITSKVDVICRQSNRMIQLIDSTHKLNLDDLNLLEPQFSEFNFDDFMRRLLSDFNFVAEQECKTLEIDGAESYVKADRALIEMAINNLLNNAFKYTQKGDKISVKYSIEDNEVILKITNSGGGISQEDLPYIFERYYRGSEVAKHRTGTGIGLSFTKRLIEIHSGTIAVHSTPRIGVSFIVTLPKVEPSELSLPADNISTIGDSTIILDTVSDTSFEIGEDVKGSVVYVVEDNYSMRTLIAEWLSPFFDVTTFESGESCLARMQEEWPQVLLSDVMMEGMDGFELCKRIKSSLVTCHIPVILLTGLSSVDDKIKGLEAGADAYIYKPFYINHLLTRISSILRSSEMLRQRFESGIPTDSQYNNSINKLDKEFIDRLHKIFDDNLENEEIDMDYIAGELFLSRAALYNKIKAVMGSSTPYELLKNYRLTRAASLLEQGEVSVTEVCALTGFKNRAHFSKIFKDRYGVSPSKYLK